VRTLYERVGGDAFFTDLVERFYAAVADDPILRPLYPEDLCPSKYWLAQFLVQYWGGPRRYDETRGHPRLRMRHAPFVITSLERDRWWTHMAAAVQASDLPPDDAAELLAYFDMAATAMVNRHG
jgi:hemoglobin